MKPDAMRDALEAERRRVEGVGKAMEERQEEILHKEREIWQKMRCSRTGIIGSRKGHVTY